jgi:hypothetical protein
MLVGGNAEVDAEKVASWQNTSDSSLAPETPSPEPCKAVSRCFSEDDWSSSSGATEASSESSEQLFDLAKSGDGSCAALSSVSSLNSSIRSCPMSTTTKVGTLLESATFDRPATDRPSTPGVARAVPHPGADSEREALEATVAALRVELAAEKREHQRTANALDRKVCPAITVSTLNIDLV